MTDYVQTEQVHDRSLAYLLKAVIKQDGEDNSTSSSQKYQKRLYDTC